MDASRSNRLHIYKDKVIGEGWMHQGRSANKKASCDRKLESRQKVRCFCSFMV